MKKTWTDEDAAKLRHLRMVERMSIGDLCRVLGLSKGTIMGKLNRMGLIGKAIGQPRRGGFHLKSRFPRGTTAKLAVALDPVALQGKARAPVPERVPLPVPVRPAPGSGVAPARPRLLPRGEPLAQPPSHKGGTDVGKMWEAMQGQPIAPARSCQWPFGEPRTPEFQFCAAAVEAIGIPYCAKHQRLAHVRRAA